MTAFDYGVLLIIGLSILLSVLRGLVREVLALVSWVAALWIARVYTMEFAPMLPDTIPTLSLRYLAAFIILFLLVLLFMTLLTIALSHFIKALGIGPADRLLGAAFGLVRGVVMVLTFMLLAGLTSLPRQTAWRDAMFSTPLEAFIVKMVLPHLPKSFAKRINYE